MTKNNSGGELDRGRIRWNKIKSLYPEELAGEIIPTLLNTAMVNVYRKKDTARSLLAVATSEEDLEGARLAFRWAASIVRMAGGKMKKKESRKPVCSFLSVVVVRVEMKQLNKADYALLHAQHRQAVKRRDVNRACHEAGLHEFHPDSDE